MVEYALLAGFLAVSAGATIPGTADSISTIFLKIRYLTGPECLGAPGNPSSNGCGPPTTPTGQQ